MTAPASIGNVAAGFDVLGLALQPQTAAIWRDRVTVTRGERDDLHITGRFAGAVPATAADNLCMIAATLVRAQLGLPNTALRVELDKGLPAGSGLGSSSASAVAAAVATCELLDPGRPRSERIAQVLDIAGQTEAHATGAGHLDNVAPCLLGGLQLLTPLGPRPLPWPRGLQLVVASPDFAVATRDARAVLPKQVELHTAVEHAGNLGALVLALHAGEVPLIAATLRDLLAEPYRAALGPGFAQAKAGALAAGALGCSLSGAGPAVFAVCPEHAATAVAAALRDGFANQGHAADVQICAVAELGALDRVERHERG
ncbi:MAG: homoserine kinase [Deltaproteobacteria bacterium]|nr:homoserine kinase [Deltaproteobacteria bacterium]